MVIVQDGPRWLHFARLGEVVTAVAPAEVAPALAKVEAAVSEQGLHAAGYMAYEAAAAYDLSVHPPLADASPLLWFGLYAAAETVSLPAPSASCQLSEWRPSLSVTDFRHAVGRIKAYIAAGHTYQVNLTFPLQSEFHGDPWTLFQQLVAQQAGCAAYLDTGRFVICSVSPELFVRRAGEMLLSRPMKGTSQRGRTLAEDRTRMAWLQQSEKDRAENLMIVDMIRNDMGRIAEVGTVRVPHLFAAERYPTLLQMTSTVTARTRRSWSEIMAAMFPCASVTGAPKIRTMQIIRELEPEARGVYTGAIGFLSPSGEGQFNVAIRTLVLDRQTGQARYGVGSGIVWDSQADAEYEECLLKAAVVRRPRASFKLLESLLWEPESGYFLLEEHLARLADSAEYFGVPADLKEIRSALVAAASDLTEPVKVRLLVDLDGAAAVQVEPLGADRLAEPVRVKLAAEPVDSADPFLYHKTTCRQTYERALAGRGDCDDVLLWNERGEVTETGNSNVVLALGGELSTPHQFSGLLAGTFRGWLLAHGRIRERVITLADLRRAEGVYLINSVRRWRRAVICDP